MTDEQRIADLEKRLDELEKQRDEVLVPQLQWVRGRFMPTSGYLRAEAIPQLVGDVTHLAGTEPVNVSFDRYSWVVPATGGNGIAVCQTDQDEDTTILNVTEEGFLSTIGVVVSKSTGAAGTVDVYLDVTIDGGTTQSRQLAFGARVFGTTLSSNVTRTSAGAGAQTGGTQEDSLLFHFGIPYKTSLVVHIRAENAAGFTGGVDEWDLAGIVDRAVLTSG